MDSGPDIEIEDVDHCSAIMVTSSSLLKDAKPNTREVIVVRASTWAKNVRETLV